jgi:hypothetical protein
LLLVLVLILGRQTVRVLKAGPPCGVAVAVTVAGRPVCVVLSTRVVGVVFERLLDVVLQLAHKAGQHACGQVVERVW